MVIFQSMNWVTVIYQMTHCWIRILNYHTPDFDYSGLVKKALDVKTRHNHLSWFDYQRYSVRQDRKMLMGGLTGEIEYAGNLQLFLSFLKMVGKVGIRKIKFMPTSSIRISAMNFCHAIPTF